VERRRPGTPRRYRRLIGRIHLRDPQYGAVHSRPAAAPTAVVTAIASALQKATRKAPTLTFAPPTLADQPPRKSRQARPEVAIAAIRYGAGAIATTPNGSAAPTEKLAAEAKAACSGRARDVGDIPSSSRAC